MSDVYQFVQEKWQGGSNFKLMTSFPRKTIESSQITLKDLGFVPSVALICQ